MATTYKTLIDYPGGASTLAANITAAVESIVLSSDPGTAFPTANFWVRIGYEQILVATRSGATLTCTGGRGANGTTAAIHASGEAVTCDLFAAHLTAIQTAIGTLETTGAMSALAVAGNATIGGTLGVTLAATFGSTVSAKSVTVRTPSNGAGQALFTSDAITNTMSEAGGYAMKRAADAGSGVAGATEDGWTLGTISAAGHSGSGYDSGGAIVFQQDGAVSGTNIPGRIVFMTAPNSGGLSTALTLYSTNRAMFAGPVGFNGTAPISKPTITGSRGGNAAVQSIAAALANLGLVTDSTS